MSDEHKSRQKNAEDGSTGCVWAIAAVVIVIVLIMAWTSRNAGKLGPSDDPYYDAPSGQTRGGDTY